MRLKAKHLTLLLGIGLASAAATGAWAQNSPKFEAWLKAAKLGVHQGEDNWDEIIAAAKKDGTLDKMSMKWLGKAAGDLPV